jgi:hypothetical protein
MRSAKWNGNVAYCSTYSAGESIHTVMFMYFFMNQLHGKLFEVVESHISQRISISNLLLYSLSKCCS